MGTATISHGGLSHTLRCDPTDISWTYKLNTKVEETYGGRVVQILSISMEDLTVRSVAGAGRWNYLYSLVTFCRDIMFQQLSTGEPSTFSFPGRGWVIKGFLQNVPFSDTWDNTAYPFSLSFRVQEDVTGIITSDSIASELDKIREGIGYERNEYNYPQTSSEDEEGEDQPERPTDDKGDKIAGPYLGSDGKYH